jgi:activating signal cointegrator 1
MEYKVLTFWQPWATLLVHGIKKIETRPKPTTWTKEKGIYLIHAAQKWSKEQYRLCLKEPFYNELEKLGYNFSIVNSLTNIPLGKIIGSIEVTECCKIYNPEHFILPYIFPKGNINGSELHFGDYRDGRYAWLCENSHILKDPIPYKGGQGYYQNFKGDKSQLIFL